MNRREVAGPATWTADAPGQRGYLDFIDGLRAISILAVVAFHIGFPAPSGGFFGVDIFFVISGFLIIGQIVADCEAGTFRFGRFWARRVLRILPSYLLVIFACILLSLYVLVAPGEMFEFSEQVMWSAGMAMNSWLIRHVGYFDTDSNVKELLHLWSLAVEEQFYLVWPLVLIVVLRRTTVPVVVARWLCAAIFVAALVMVMRSVLGASMVALYYGSESVGSLMLLTGAVVAFWFEQSDGRACRLQRIVSWACVPAAALIGTLGLTVRVEKACFLYLGGWLVVAAAVAIVLVAALDDSSLTGQLLAVHPLRWVGKISYGLYLWHFPLLYLIQYALVPQGFRSAVIAAIAVPAAVGMATLSFYLLERPINRAGRARLQRFEQCHLRRASSWP